MSDTLKLYVRGGFDFVDDETGFTTSDFGVSDNAINERVTDTSLPAHEQEIEFAKESIENGVYDSTGKSASERKISSPLPWLNNLTTSEQTWMNWHMVSIID